MKFVLFVSLALACATPAFATGAADLATAVRANDATQVTRLLASGIAADACDDADRPPPLVIAVVGKQAPIARLLLDAGATVDARHPTYYNATALMLAVNNRDAAMVSLLLDAGADVNLQDKAGDTALNWATFYGDEAIAEQLLAHGVDATLFGHGNALDVAMRRGHQRLVQRYTTYLQRVNPVSAADAVFFAAVAAGDVTALRRALENGADIDALDVTHRGALALAARSGDVATARALLDTDAAIDATDPIGFTPLLEAARDGRLDMVTLLLDRGADVRHRADKNGLTLSVLHLAAAAGKADVVELLLARGAELDARDSELATPLLWATNQAPTIALLLVQRGADPDLATIDGLTPRQAAQAQKNVALLAAMGARGND